MKRSVISIYPDNTGFQYENLFNREFAPLTATPEHERPIYIQWTVDGALPHGMFPPNHFVWLRETPFQQEPRVVTNTKKGTKRNSRTPFDFNFVPMKKQANSNTDNYHDNSQSKCNIEKNKDESSRKTEDIEPPPSPQPSSVEADMDTGPADGTNISSMPTETQTDVRGLPDQNRHKTLHFRRDLLDKRKKSTGLSWESGSTNSTGFITTREKIKLSLLFLHGCQFKEPDRFKENRTNLHF